MIDLWEKETVLRQIFNNNFCTHLLDFLIKEEMTTSNFQERGKKFFPKIKEWRKDYLLKEEKMELYGVMASEFHLVVMELCLDFYAADKEEVGKYALMMFLLGQFEDLKRAESACCNIKYDEDFFRRYYPEFLEFFVGREGVISDFEKVLCDEFQYEFSQESVVQMTKESLIQELKEYEESSLCRFSYYCEEYSENKECIEKLKKEYPRYHDFVSKLEEDAGILQVFRINELSCDFAVYYIVERQDSVCFLLVEDYV